MTVSFRVKLLATHAAVALAVGAVTLAVVERTISQRMEVEVDRRLESQARAVARWTRRAGHPDRLAGRLAGVVGARVTVLDARGVAVGESLEGAAADPSEATGREVQAARAGHVGHAKRFSRLEGEEVRYVAVPATDGAVVRLGLPLGEIDATKSALRRQLGASALASLLAALALAALVAGPLTRRLREATASARRLGAGDYDRVKPSQAGDEIGVLSRTLASVSNELRQAEERRREFLATVAHEIRTPVTSIRGYAQMLSGSNVPSADRDEFLQTIHRNAVRVGDLVDDLLQLEALEAGRGRELACDEVDLGAVMRHVAETVRASASESGAALRVELAQGLGARGDADAIERILLNLTDNAIKHGGRGVEVDVVGERRGERVLVTVRDSGPGIPSEQRGRVFERFHRASPPTSEVRGTGLGLAIARELAQAMGGKLGLDETDGPGTCFRLELPGA